MYFRICSTLFVFCLLGSVVMSQPAASDAMTAPASPLEFRAVWVATVSNIDWPSKPGLSSEQQKKELLDILDRCVELNMNAVILQVRPMCDALYASPLEPWSGFLTGAMGKAPDPYYDPLEFAIVECHKRGLELHAWFNPYRAHHSSDKSPISDKHISKTHPNLTKKYGTFLWLDPGEKAVQDHSMNVILDVVKRYDLDGVHIDDYFYPYKVKDKDGKVVDFPDTPSWDAYKKHGGTLTRDNWRRDNVNRFVERFYKEVKAEKSWVKVGISPFGIWRPGHPPSVKGLDQYSELYADAKLWLVKGWVDYWTPQLYWKLDAPQQPHRDLLKWWVENNPTKRHVWPGNFTSKIRESGSAKWPDAEIVNQVKATRAQPGATGNVHFSMKALMGANNSLVKALKAEVYLQPALIPPSPWIQSKPPQKPTVEARRNAAGQAEILIATAAPGDKVFLWAVHQKQGGQWTFAVHPAVNNTLTLKFNAGATPEAVSIAAVDRMNNEGPRAVFTPAKK